MNDFTFHNPTKLIFGKSSLKELAENAKSSGQKILLTYGKGSIKENGVYDAVMAELNGFEVREFSGIEPNPRVETIRKGIEVAREFAPDLILAVGGGSVIDGAKLLAAATYYEGDAWDFLIKPGIEPKKYIPLATVLTLAATNSEMNSGSVITNWTENRKLFFERPQLFPVFSILNPEYTYTLPTDQTAYGVIDTFVHVIEQYINTTLDAPLQDRFAESLLQTVIENAVVVLENPRDYDARSNLMLCATMALNGLIQMGVGQDWATHNIEHEVSAFYDITHAAGLAIILPRWMEVVATEQKHEKLVQYGKRVWNLSGSDEEVAQAAIKATFDFFKSLGAKMNLSDYQITSEHFPVMVERLSSTKTGEIALTAEQIRAILDKSL